MNKSETIKQFMDFNPYLNDENKNRLLNPHANKLNVLKIQPYLNKALELKQKGVNNQDIVKLLSENNYDWYQYYLPSLAVKLRPLGRGYKAIITKKQTVKNIF